VCLSDAVIAFSHKHPQIRVSLTLSDFTFRPGDFVEDGFDVAVRIADIRDSSVMAAAYRRAEMALCATPEFVNGKARRAALRI